jgi:3-phenylpropionate/trans-cinnamate dioxygenase ferredoxin reductase subunit
MQKESFCAFYLRQGTLISADAVNRPQEFMLAKRMVTDRASVTAAQLRDEGISLKALAASLKPA